jgi:hypothetical protein
MGLLDDYEDSHLPALQAAPSCSHRFKTPDGRSWELSQILVGRWCPRISDRWGFAHE